MLIEVARRHLIVVPNTQIQVLDALRPINRAGANSVGVEIVVHSFGATAPTTISFYLQESPDVEEWIDFQDLFEVTKLDTYGRFVENISGSWVRVSYKVDAQGAGLGGVVGLSCVLRTYVL